MVEIPSPEDATVLKLHAEEGETITVGNVIVTLGDEDEEPSSADAGGKAVEGNEESGDTGAVADMTVAEVKGAVKDGDINVADALAAERKGKERKTLISWLEDRDEAESGTGSSSVVGVLEDADTEEEASGEGDEPAHGDAEGSEAGTVLAAPSVRKLARGKDIDITQVDGSGPGGRVTRDDVVQYAEEGQASETEGDTASSEQVLATPATRRLAKKQGVDIVQIDGSGPDGRVTKDDVRAAAGGEQAAKEPGEGVEEEPAETDVGVTGGLGTPNRFPPKEYDFEQYGDVEREAMSGTRKAIAKNMERSKYTSPHVTSTDDADVTALWNVRKKEKEVAEDRGVHLTFLPFIVKAAISALRQFPRMNASLDETTGEIVKKNYYNIGIAVATDDGLMVPNIKDADTTSILKIAKEMNELAEQARNHELGLDDMRGGTFTITNYGSIGGRYGTPILNYPEVAILGTGTISDEPVVRNGEVVVRKMLPLSVTFDHRVVDGAYVARFMNELIKHLVVPDLLLLDE